MTADDQFGIDVKPTLDDGRMSTLFRSMPLAEMMSIVEHLDFAEYTDPAHSPMIPHVVVLKPGLVVYKICVP
jgi:hypothetical protein